MSQLSIYDALISDKANELVRMLNEGMPNKEKYSLIPFALQRGPKVIISAINREGKKLFNVITDEAEMPKDESVCWRGAQSIIQEFNLKTIKEPT